MGAIAKLDAQTLQEPPIALASSETIGALEMVLQVLLNAVVVDQRVVHVDEKNDRMRLCHAALPAWPFVPAARQIQACAKGLINLRMKRHRHRNVYSGHCHVKGTEAQ